MAAAGATIRVHVSHAQSVLRLPKNAVRLATNARDINQAFRVGANAWGVQFHPEFDAEIVRAYIEHCRSRLIAEGQDPDSLMREAADTESGTEILTRFAKVRVGILIRKSDPLPGWLAALIVPPCASTIALAIERPIPAPPVARLRDESTR